MREVYSERLGRSVITKMTNLFLHVSFACARQCDGCDRDGCDVARASVRRGAESSHARASLYFTLDGLWDERRGVLVWRTERARC